MGSRHEVNTDSMLRIRSDEGEDDGEDDDDEEEDVRQSPLRWPRLQFHCLGTEIAHQDKALFN